MENLIKTLFLEMSETEEYAESPEEIEAQAIAHKHDKRIEELIGDDSLYNEVEELITDQIYNFEKSAFAMGFKTAMNLMMQSKLSKVVSL